MQSEIGDSRVDSPWKVEESNNNYHYYLEIYATAPNVAASFDPELQFRMGEEVGLQALIVGLPILWGPGLNTHRTAYNGRNGDYYSEDPVLTGTVGMEFAIGAFKYGLLASPKHYAFNDQETNRGGIAPFMTEQRAREIELRAFQIPMEANKYNETAPAYWTGSADHDFGMRGMMTSFSKIGAVECTASQGLITDIAKKEWGFQGYVVTDIGDDTDLFASVVNAGATGYDLRGRFAEEGFPSHTNHGEAISAALFAHDANILTKLKDAAHNTIWAFCQTNLMNAYNASTSYQSLTTWWRVAYTAAIIVTAVLFVAFAALYTLSVIKAKKEEK
jgi:beta-glucosidase